MPRLSSLYLWINNYISNKHIRISSSEIHSIIAGITGISKEHLLIHKDSIVSNSDSEKIKRAVKKRGTHYPLQYITGSVEFMGIDFLVTLGVLIPRPETELLVETALKYTGDRKYRHILDLCCGSGVIGLSIACMDKHTLVSLSDSSAGALRLTHKNSDRLGLSARVKIYRGDLFSALPARSKFDLIVSNPPYVPHGRIRHLQKEVSFEPVKAIDGGRKGLEVINKIIQQAGSFLDEDGMLFIEHDDTHKEYLETFFDGEDQPSLRYIKTINDFSGLPRMSIFSRRHNKARVNAKLSR